MKFSGTTYYSKATFPANSQANRRKESQFYRQLNAEFLPSCDSFVLLQLGCNSQGLNIVLKGSSLLNGEQIRERVPVLCVIKAAILKCFPGTMPH